MAENLPARVEAREPTVEEVEARAERAFALDLRIRRGVVNVHEAWWDLAEALHEFQEGYYWQFLDCDTLEEFLAQPEIGLSRSQFFQMTRLWRDLVETRRIPVEDLKEIEPSKVREVAPAIMRGEVDVDDALDDARALGYRDVREKYHPKARQRHGQKPDDSKRLAAEDEPERVKCEACGSWYVPEEAEEPERQDGP